MIINKTAIILIGYKLTSPVLNIWNRLGRVHAVRLTAATGDRRGFFHDATADGHVEIIMNGRGVMIFNETGVWTSVDQQTVDFRNVYRWALSEPEGIIRLAHLRYGADRPVHLVDFGLQDPHTLQSLQPHHCGADRYSASLSAAEDGIVLCWTIRGPTKDDTLHCTYVISE
ncbi:MAG: DUF6314 family protein [Thermodesulfobacteriota bacterium]